MYPPDDNPERTAANAAAVNEPAGFWSKTSNIIGMSILAGIGALVLVVGLILDNAEPDVPSAEEQQREEQMGECLDSGQTVEECANPALNP